MTNIIPIETAREPGSARGRRRGPWVEVRLSREMDGAKASFVFADPHDELRLDTPERGRVIEEVTGAMLSTAASWRVSADYSGGPFLGGFWVHAAGVDACVPPQVRASKASRDQLAAILRSLADELEQV